LPIRISKYLILLIFFSHTLLGCALCAVYSPETQVAIKVNANQQKIKSINFTWVLTKAFTEQLKQVYDINQDNNIDKKELIPIQKALLDYIIKKHYLTHISYDKVINKDKTNPIKVTDYKTYIKNSLLHFNYTVKLDYDVIKDNILYINVDDDENYFILIIPKIGVDFKAPFKIKKVFNRQSVAFYIQSEPKRVEDRKPVEKQDENIATKVKQDSLLLSFTKKIKKYLLKINNGDNYALFILLGISFLYGLIHALGPGHGKSLAFSYFVANRSSYLKAFFISQATAFIHIVGALILVVVSVFILESILNNFVKDSVKILTQISASMIILLAIYILYNKLRHKSCTCSSCCSTPKPSWSVNKPTTASILKPNFMKKDLYFVLTAGLIPCPGTVILFIYAFILKTYFAVLLASIFISLGMGVVIFASSFLGVSVQKVSQNSHKLTRFFEILAPIVMIGLSIFLFISANAL
jgi:nickel/cobalt transporter (NicO) family protein